MDSILIHALGSFGLLLASLCMFWGFRHTPRNLPLWFDLIWILIAVGVLALSAVGFTRAAFFHS